MPILENEVEVEAEAGADNLEHGGKEKEKRPNGVMHYA